MNVLHICDFAAPIRGNFVEELDTIDHALKSELNGQNVYAFTSRNIERKNQWLTELAEEHPVYIYENSPLEKIKLFGKIIKKHEIGIVHVHFTDMKTDLCIDIASAFTGVRIVKHYRSSYGILSKKKRLVAKAVYKNWSYICISPAMIDECKINYPNCKCHLVLNPIYFDRIDKISPLTKQDITGSEQGILCFMLGYNYKLKGIDLAAEAVAKLRDRYDLRLAVCVTTHIEKIQEELRNQFGGAVPEWITLLPPRNDIGTYYQVADIFLSPSRSEGACSAAVEQAYFEKPVVASNCAGQYSYLNGRLNILWFENKNSDSLAEKIVEAIDFRSNSELLAENRVNAVKYYGFDIYTEKIIEEYKNLL